MEKMKKYFNDRKNKIKQRFEMRVEQELMVLRYALFCRPSLKTIVVLLLRIAILLCSFIVFTSILVSQRYIDSLAINVGVLSLFLWIVAKFLWEFGYTIKHIKRYAVWLGLLLLLPLPLYILIYSSTFDDNMARFQLQSSSTTTMSSMGHRIITSPHVKVSSISMGRVRVSTNLQSSLDLDEADVKAEVIGMPLAYPNPFRASQGTELGYELSKDMDVEIRVYNMFGHMVRQEFYYSAEEGGTKGYNRVALSGEDAMGRTLSAAAYFYLIISDGDVLAKGKMAVIP